MTAANQAAVETAIEASQRRGIDVEDELAGEGAGWQTQPAIVKLRSLFKHLKTHLLRGYAFSEHTGGLGPVLPCDTRWNSWFTLIERGLATRRSIAHFTAEY